MGCQPRPHGLRLVRAVVVHDQVDILLARHRCINGFEELQELHAAVTGI